MELWLRGGKGGDLDEIDLARWQRLAFLRFDMGRAGYQRAKLGGTPLGRFPDVLARELVNMPSLAKLWKSTLGTNPEHLPDGDFVSAVNERVAELESEAIR